MSYFSNETDPSSQTINKIAFFRSLDFADGTLCILYIRKQRKIKQSRTRSNVVRSKSPNDFLDGLCQWFTESLWIFIVKPTFVRTFNYRFSGVLKSMKCKKADTKTVLLLWNISFLPKSAHNVLCPRSGSRTTLYLTRW